VTSPAARVNTAVFVLTENSRLKYYTYTVRYIRRRPSFLFRPSPNPVCHVRASPSPPPRYPLHWSNTSRTRAYTARPGDEPNVRLTSFVFVERSNVSSVNKYGILESKNRRFSRSVIVRLEFRFSRSFPRYANTPPSNLTTHA